MNLLALDTSSIACSVALEIDGKIIDRHEEQAREHTRLLMPMIRDVFEEAAKSPADLDAIVLGNGPGSFIGMRIAASVAQGLAFGSELRIVPVSSLLAVAAAAMHDDNARFVAVCQDAHMNEVYLGLYGRGDDSDILRCRMRTAINFPGPVPSSIRQRDTCCRAAGVSTKTGARLSRRTLCRPTCARPWRKQAQPQTRNSSVI
jgi:tRNA threonylcarbamoyl adenosine modification protein YeaZ